MKLRLRLGAAARRRTGNRWMRGSPHMLISGLLLVWVMENLFLFRKSVGTPGTRPISDVELKLLVAAWVATAYATALLRPNDSRLISDGIPNPKLYFSELACSRGSAFFWLPSAVLILTLQLSSSTQ